MQGGSFILILTLHEKIKMILTMKDNLLPGNQFYQLLQAFTEQYAEVTKIYESLLAIRNRTRITHWLFMQKGCEELLAQIYTVIVEMQCGLANHHAREFSGIYPEMAKRLRELLTALETRVYEYHEEQDRKSNPPSLPWDENKGDR